MNTFEHSVIKWPYVTHMVDRRLVTAVLPVVEDVRPGALVLARVVSIGRHRQLEDHAGRGMSLYTGDVLACVLGNRHARGAFEGRARCEGPLGHIVSAGGVCGVVTGLAHRTGPPTVIEWLGRLAGPDRQPLHLTDFQLPLASPKRGPQATAILSIGTSINSGRTRTTARLVRSLTVAGHRVAAARITGVACARSSNSLRDAGALAAYDFTHVGWPSTTGCNEAELLAIAAQLRRAMAAHEPEFVVIEVAGGLVQPETARLLSNPVFRESIDAVTFAGPDALSCDAGVRRLRDLGYPVLATAGAVADRGAGIREAESASGVRCFDGAAILAGALVPDLLALGRRHGATAVAERAVAGSVARARSMPAEAHGAQPAPASRAVRTLTG